MPPLRDGVPHGIRGYPSHRPPVPGVRACVEEQGEDPAQEMSEMPVHQVERQDTGGAGMPPVRAPLGAPRCRRADELSQMQVRVLEGGEAGAGSRHGRSAAGGGVYVLRGDGLSGVL